MFNFKEVEKRTHANMPLDAVRVTKSAIRLGDNVLRGHGKGAKIGFSIDTDSDAIKLRVDDRGYVLQAINPDSPQESRFLSTGKAHKLGLPIGDYKPVDDFPNVFVRATGKQ